MMLENFGTDANAQFSTTRVVGLIHLTRTQSLVKKNFWSLYCLIILFIGWYYLAWYYLYCLILSWVLYSTPARKQQWRRLINLQQTTNKRKRTLCVSAVKVSFICAFAATWTITNHNCSMAIIFISWLFKKGGPNKIDSPKNISRWDL